MLSARQRPWLDIVTKADLEPPLELAPQGALFVSCRGNTGHQIFISSDVYGMSRQCWHTPWKSHMWGWGGGRHRRAQGASHDLDSKCPD